MYSQPAGPLLVSLIFPQRLLWNEQLCCHICLELTVPGNDLCQQQLTWPSGKVKNYDRYALVKSISRGCSFAERCLGNTSQEPVASVARECCRCVSATQLKKDAALLSAQVWTYIYDQSNSSGLPKPAASFLGQWEQSSAVTLSYKLVQTTFRSQQDSVRKLHLTRAGKVCRTCQKKRGKL